MDRDLSLSLFLLLLLCPKSDTGDSCPYRCQCFTAVQVLCADERMTSAPSSLSRQVKDVIIMTSALEYLFANTLRDSPQLNKLIFLNNGLRSIHAQAFQHLTELQELEISGNPWLDHLHLGTFSKQANLSKLLLNYNRFQTVLPGMFDSLKQLDTLKMKGNLISHLPVLLFMNLHNLRALDLSLNKLNHLNKETFSGLAQLEILTMNHNHINNISSDIFHNLSELTELHMEGNHISGLPDDVLSTLTKLRVLNLRGNLLTTFSDKVFGYGASNLKELNLRGNRLSELSSLSSLTSLTDLILSSNELTNLPEDIFKNVTALENLSLSANHLTSLPETIFNNLLNIKIIHLHTNNLSQVDAKLFKDQEFIQQLYLSDNLLESLPPGLLDPFALQPTLRLHGNPWNCDCRMWYLHEWVLKHGQDIEMLDRVLCESPIFLRKRSVTSIDKEQLVCRPAGRDAFDLSSCSLQTSSGTLVVKCKVDKCSPQTVKVQLQGDDGRIKELMWKSNVCEHSQWRNETMMSPPQ